MTEAASAFTDAFNLANGVAVAVAVAAAAGVLAWSRRRDADPEAEPEPAWEPRELELAGTSAGEWETDVMAAARAQNAAVELDPRVERSRRVILEAVVENVDRVDEPSPLLPALGDRRDA